jgi:predicted nucleotide-binding protein
MPAPPEETTPGLPEWLRPAVPRLPLPTARSVLEGLIRTGSDLKNLVERGSVQDEVKQRIEEWREFCRKWLDENLGWQAAYEFIGARQYPYEYEAPGAYHERKYMLENVGNELITLSSIAQKLDQLPPGDVSAPMATMSRSAHSANSPKSSLFLGAAKSSSTDPIFIVHGRDTASAEMVARYVEKATKRRPIILRNEANFGQTLIEKFERNAAKASYAIVVLTPDDEGGVRGQPEKSPRGRQNVIFEMGYFYGILGRDRVCVLLHPEVEKPSDLEGIAYTKLDEDFAWLRKLYRELAHAGIKVDFSQGI